MSSHQFHSVNPYSGSHFGSYDKHTSSELGKILRSSEEFYRKWSRVPIGEKAAVLDNIAVELKKVRQQLSRSITAEMGKPITQAESEVDKCIWLCEHYSKDLESLLQRGEIQLDGLKVIRRRDPLGPIFGIMPWNFPIWQAMRYAVPSIAVGNTVLLKPAPNVMGSSLILQNAIRDGVGADAIFSVLVIDTDLAADVIAAHEVRGVTFTGSDKAGGIVAGLAGKYRKRSVLELGGSDPFIVLDDADIEAAGKAFVKSRMNNSGQTCIAAKRAIVDANSFESFIDVVKDATQHMKVGDPMDESTEISCLAREDICANLVSQVNRSESVLKPVVHGGRVSGTNFYHPEHYIVMDRSAAIWREEVFGPVGAIHAFSSLDEAVSLANDTRYGLGCGIWSTDHDKAMDVASRIEAGSIHINRVVSSDPRVPFGGVKDSGYGRELGDTGIFEFANEKLVSL